MNTSNAISFTSTLSIILRDQELAQYVAACHEEAILSADRREWANAYFLEAVSMLPALIPADEQRQVAWTNGEKTGSKEQSFTYGFWVATLIPLLVAGYTSTQLIEKQLGEAFPSWTSEQVQKWAKKAIFKMAEAGLVAHELNARGIPAPVVEFIGDRRLPRVNLDQSVQEHFERWAFEHASVKLAPLPVRPMDWVSTTEGVAPDLGLRLIPKAVGRPEVGKKALQGINAMQRVAFVVNDDIRGIVQEYLDNLHSFDFKSKGAKDADIRLCRRILSMVPGQKYWLAITCDTRGRMYYRGSELTPQGKDLAKAAFCFADPVALGERGMDALWLVLANSWGTKGSIEHRIAAAQQEWTTIEPLEWFEFVEHADEPYQAYAIACEIKRALSATMGSRRFFGCKLVCHMDGSQNGYQHQATIIGDRSTAENTNLLEATESTTPFDAYMAVLDAIVQNTKLPERIRQLAKKLGRNLVKQPTMTTQYNATVGTFAKHMADEFGPDFEAAGVNPWEMANAAAEAVDRVLPAARTLINVYKDRFSEEVRTMDGRYIRVYTGPDVITWTTPDGFEVRMQYRDNEWRAIRAAQSCVVLPLEDGESDPIDGDRMLRALAANFIQSMDATHMRMIAASSAFPIVGIHDSVGCHAGHFFEVAAVVRQTFVELHSNDVLNQMLGENRVRACRFIRKTYDAREALNAVNMFS
jgi:uncharacterized protein (UPF0147 family)